MLLTLKPNRWVRRLYVWCVSMGRGDCYKIDLTAHLGRKIDQRVGWRAEFYVISRDLPPLESRLLHLQQIVVNHLDMTDDNYGALLCYRPARACIRARSFARGVLEIGRSLQVINTASRRQVGGFTSKRPIYTAYRKRFLLAEQTDQSH